MTGNRYAIFCATDPERCEGNPVFLGYGRMGEIMKCPRCGRNTAAGLYRWTLSEWRERNNARQNSFT